MREKITAIRTRTVRSVIVLLATAIAFVVSFVLLEGALGAGSPWLGLMMMFWFLGLAKNLSRGRRSTVEVYRLPASAEASRGVGGNSS